MDKNNIKIENLNVKFVTPFGSVKAVKNLTTTFTANKITGIIGESGSGKSVMGMAILQLLPENALINGTCTYKDFNLFKLGPKKMQKICGKEIGLIPQNPNASLNPMMKIRNQLKEPLLIHKLMNKKDANNEVNDLLKQFGFHDSSAIGKKYSFQMSGGMNQRIVSALGLACKPNWIIADEPTKGLDAIMRNQVYRVLKKIYSENNCGMIVITHDLMLAFHLCDEIRVMYSGEIIEQGPCKNVFESPLHPYTKGLLNALPQNGMKPVPYGSKNIDDKSSACAFFNRCPNANSNCLNKKMENFSVSEKRKVRCFNYA
ncbi:ABC transporter ATP-binding protein [Clostridium ihumii]|uniref:ABC transporter ATP-binding protein n=1 Tax=Clostridium ihumii TaxID=1470356 RepID=UPI003D33A538